MRTHNRRDFMKQTAAGGFGAAALTTAGAESASAQSVRPIRVGFVGVGDRGSGCGKGPFCLQNGQVAGYFVVSDRATVLFPL